MEQTMVKNGIRLMLVMLSVVIAATLSLGLSAHPAEAMTNLNPCPSCYYPDGQSWTGDEWHNKAGYLV